MGDLSPIFSPTWIVSAISIHPIGIVFTLVLCSAGYLKVPECCARRRGGEGSPHCCLPKTGLLVRVDGFKKSSSVSLRLPRGKGAKENGDSAL